MKTGRSGGLQHIKAWSVREPATWRGKDGDSRHIGLFRSPADKVRNARMRAAGIAREQKAKAKREAEAERWIASLRMGKAMAKKGGT